MPNALDTHSAPVLSRRALIGTAAWSVPVVAVSAAVPAHAATSTVPLVSVTSPDNTVPASGGTRITTTVRTAQGQPRAGQAVSLTGPTGSTIAAPNGTTDGAGQYATDFDLHDNWAYPGSTATITALSGGDSGFGAFTVVGANLVQCTTSNGSFSQSQMPLNFPSPVVQYASALTWHFAILADGSLWARDRRTGGAFTRQTGVSDVVSLAACTNFNGTYWVLRRDGTVWAWGGNTHGQLGDGTTNDRWTPAPVPGLTDVVKISATTFCLFALKSDGTSWALGGNFIAGRAGVGSTVDTIPVTQQANGTDVVDIVGRPSLGGMFLKADGTVWMWGSSVRGYSGMGSTSQTAQTSPVQVPGLSDIASITIGMGAVDWNSATMFVLDKNGNAWGWGDNYTGVLGANFSGDRALSPVPLAGLSGATQLAVNNGMAFALMPDGTVKGWGNGLRTPTSVATPRPVTSLQQVCNASAYDTTLSYISGPAAGS